MPRALTRCTLLLLLCAPMGCRPEDPIRAYTVPKEQPPAGQVAERFAPPQGQTDRMLAAILEGDDQAWFFKLVAPVQQVDPLAETTRRFLESVEYDAKAGRPAWLAPKGWEERPAEGMRLATLVAPSGVELSVIGLPLVGDWDAQVLDNVNRWRGQLGLPPGGEDGVEQTKSGEQRLAIVDLRGAFDSAGMAPPGVPAPPVAGDALPPVAGRDGPPSPPGRPTYKVPPGWTELPPGIRLIDMRTADAPPAEATAFAFPASAPAMADPLENVNRWRGEVGMPPTDQASLDADREERPFSGGSATLVELVPEEGTKATLAAMTRRGDLVWFFKLHGPKEAVVKNRDAFRAWLDSVELP